MTRMRTSLLFIICYLLFISCDLFTGPKVDLFQVIGDEVDWANAPKLTARIDYPPAWGISSPSQGGITMDIRKGYEFNVEFTPPGGVYPSEMDGISYIRSG